MAQPKANAVKFGISNLHVAFLKEDGKTYDDPVAVPGTVSLTTDPEGETSTFYADNKAYYVTTSNKGYTGTLETAGIPPETLAKMLGQATSSTGGIVETGDDKPTAFAMGGEIDGDPLRRRFWFYKVTLSRASMEAATVEESVEPATDSHDMTITGIDTGDWVNLIKYSVTDEATDFGTFFDSVTIPTKKSEQTE